MRAAGIDWCDAIVIIDALEPWGLLPLGLPLLLIASHRLTHLLLGDSTRLDRLAGLGVVGMALVHALVATLGALGVLTTNALLGALLLVTVVALLLTRELPMSGWWRVLKRHPLAVALTVGPLVLAVVTARLVPVWQWDSIGYHLPFVHFVIQAKGFAEVPSDLHYISTYPHDIELGMIALRLLLPDDRLVDLAQVPYGLVGAVLTAAIARKLEPASRLLAPRREGDPPRMDRQYALLAGALWLVVPCVFLQLPTNYVDVGTAAALLGAVYFLALSPVSWRTVLLGSLALGLFLGSKPSAPMATVVMGAVATWRCWQAKQRWAIGLLAGVVLLFGAEMYLLMLVRHGNPVWPVAVKVGPWTLPGTHAVTELLAAGAALPSAQGSLLERLSVSWLAVTSSPSFDMKVGGLGLPFLVALPFAVLALVRRRSLLLGVVVLATLLSPDPSLGRYVLAFAAMVLALAVAELEHLKAPRWLMAGGAAAVMAVQLFWSVPGLTGDGPPLSTLWALSDEQRRVAVGPHGRPTDYPRVWDAVSRGEAAAFDEGFEFPGLLWSPTLEYPVFSLPKAADASSLERWVVEKKVRVLAVSPPHGALLSPDSWRKLFDCRSSPCAVYLREGPALSARE
jgi:hypothetical protein